jgi:cyclophilin family peptidyl-prolyl cis-trans isomerase
MRVIAGLGAVLVLAACGGDASSGGTPPAPAASPAVDCHNGVKAAMEQQTAPPAQTIDPSKTYIATVHTDRGDFTLKLDPKAAPVTANNFVHLAQQHFYDCLTFHRVVPGFVAQGGDPQGNGTGGLGYKLPNETNSAPWTTGSLAMASNAAGVSACQFFVLLGDAPHLATSGVYNHFGTVQSGMDVVQKIQQGDQIKSIDISIQ